MAETKDQDLDLQPGDAGWSFRAEMAATNLLMGYWKQLVAVLIVGLLSVLFYNQYQDWVQRSQREVGARIAEVERKLPAPIVELPQVEQVEPDKVSAEALIASAGEIEAIARAASGTGAVEGLLKAAELYRIAGETEKQRGALEAAAGEAEGVLAYAAVGALANLDLEQGRGEEAVTRLRTLMDSNDGFLAQQAAVDLGMALEHLGRTDEAQQVYGQFLEKWPTSPRAEEVGSRRARLGGGEG